MTTNAISTTIRTSRFISLAHARALASLTSTATGTFTSRLRAAWDGLAVSGQLGPDPETDVGRAAGARI